MKANIKKPVPQKHDYKYTLTVGMIVKNEEKYLRRCLESLAKLREKISMEIIITDTGSTDKTLEIANEFADKITHFEWCNDFGAARNVGMDMAQGEWFMYIDADEWLDDDLVCEIAEFFNSGAYKKHLTAQVNQKSYTDFKLTAFANLYVTRLTSMATGQRFTTPIHEVLIDFPPSHYFNAPMHHTGYVYQSNMQANKKLERNNKLIEEYLKDNPNNLGMLFSYVRTVPENKKQAVVEKILSFLGTPQGDTDYVSIMTYAIASFYEGGQQQRGIELMEMHEKQTALKANLDIYYHAALIYRQAQLYDKALNYAKLYLEDLESYNKNPARHLYKMVYKARDVDKNEMLFCALQCLAIKADADEFEKYYSLLILDEIDISGLCRRMLSFFYSFEFTYALKPLYQTLCTALAKKKKNAQEAMNIFCCDLLNNLSDNRIHEALNQYFPDDELTAYYDLFSGYDKKLKADIEHTRFNAFKLIWLLMYTNEDCSSVLCDMNSEEIGECAVIIANHAEIMNLYPKISALPRENIHSVAFCHYINSRILKVAIESDAQNKFEIANATLNDYELLTRMLYNKELICEDKISILPQANRFAINIVAAKNQGGQEYLDAMKEAVRDCPSMKELAEVLLEEFEKSIEERISQSAEFAKLAAKVKQTIPGLIAAGRVNEALTVLNQLKTLMPNDKEVDEFIYQCGQL